MLASSWPAKRFPGRFRQGFTQLSSSFLISFVFWGRSISFPEKVVQRVPRALLYNFVSLFFQYLVHVSPTVLLPLGSSAIVKVLAKWQVRFLFFCRKWFWPPTRFFGVFIRFRASHAFWGKRQLLQKRFWRTFPQLLSTFVFQMAVASEKNSLERSASCAVHVSASLHAGVKVVWIVTCFNHTNPARRKGPIMSLLLGYSLGVFFLKNTIGKLRETVAVSNRPYKKTIKSKSREKVLHISFPYKIHRDTKYHMFQLEKFRSIMG